MVSFAFKTASIIGLLIASAQAADDPARPETFTEEQRSHWSFRPIARPEIPHVADTRWTSNPIDRIIKSATDELGLSHAPEADRVALIRRVTYDLTGLPPSPDDVFAFLADPLPDAYERVVDRLLASPQFGVRWAQHWLDLAHYADSNGFELDADRPDSWRYRDWVVGAFNEDMPYDRFVALQVGGDDLEPGSHEALIASGFSRCGPREVVSGNIDPAVRRQDELTEITSTVSSVFLGLTMGCARCHDHKFDPLPTTDYYRLQSFFAAAEMADVAIASESETKAYDGEVKRIHAQIDPLRKQKNDLEEPFRKVLKDRKTKELTEAERAVLAIPEASRNSSQKKLAAGAQKTLNVTWEEVAAAVKQAPDVDVEREKIKRAIHALDLLKPQPPAKAMALRDSNKQVPETFVLRRGDVKSRGPKVTPRPPGILLVSAAESDPMRRRGDLAKWMIRGDNPLTSRVIVNRLWQHHFGRGLVATPSDFGVRGESPSHSDLLDWLAFELIEGGWKLKPIHRLMVTSATYRQASRVDRNAFRKNAEDDPENAYLWRMNRRRMEAEGLRDAMLFASGELNLASGGPGVRAPIEKEIEDLIFTEDEVVDLWPETSDPREANRRSLYLYRKRNVRYPMFDAFDAPDSQTACPIRGVSIHALQPLVTLNSQFALDSARDLAERAGSDNHEAAISAMYRYVLQRSPSRLEKSEAMAFLQAQDFAHAAWVDLALAMLNRNEFLFIP